MHKESIPLFPLHSVLLPGGPLVLRIFEPRYVDMVSRCLKEDLGFGVVLIREGTEVGEAALTYDVGTYGRISYFHRRSDGLLGVTLLGERRFRILCREVLPDHLTVAEVAWLEAEVPEKMGPAHRTMVELLSDMLDQLPPPYATLTRRLDDASWVASRLVELLPLDLEQKQRLLQMDSTERVQQLMEILANGPW